MPGQYSIPPKADAWRQYFSPFHPTTRPPPDKTEPLKVRLPFSSSPPKTYLLLPLAYVGSPLAILCSPNRVVDLYVHQDERELTHALFHRDPEWFQG